MVKQPVILMGFKHVGKTLIGRELAKRLHCPFIDLDEEIERVFASETQEKISCREIMLRYGEDYFRTLEMDVFKQIPLSRLVILSLGGGTPMNSANAAFIKKHIAIHIQAPQNLVYERIMCQGTPAFFAVDAQPWDEFHRVWQEREAVYQALARFTIHNDGAIETAVAQIANKLSSI